MPAATDAIWLDVLPSMRGFAPALEKGVGPAATGAGKKAGTSFGKAALAATAIVATGAALATKALFNIGSTFQEVENTIRVGTGATGDALRALTDSAKVVATQVPASFDDVSTAIADLNTRLGLTGTELEDRSAQFLELSRITDTDVSTNIEKVTRVFGDWDVATENQADTMDMLFRASQATGIGVDDLASKVVQFGSPLRAMGFSLEESAAMFGKFEQEGVNAELVIGSLRQGLGRMARAGEDAPETFRRVVEEIEGMESRTEATAAAMELFGARAGPDMAAAIQEGRFELDELMEVVENGGETILDAAGDTVQFSEQWQMFKNRVMVDLAPLAKRVFDTITAGMTWIADHGIPTIRTFGQWVQRNSSWLAPLAAGIGGVVTALAGLHILSSITVAAKALFAVLAANPFGLVVVLIAGLVAALVTAYKHSETFRAIVDAAWQGVQTVVRAVVSWFTDTAWPAIKGVWDAIADGATRLWRNYLKPAWEGIRLAVQVAVELIKLYWQRVLKPQWEAVAAVATWLWRNVLQPTFTFIAAAWQVLVLAVRMGWQRVLKPTWDALSTAARFMWDRVLEPVFGWIGDRWDRILTGMRVVWETVLRPTFDAVSTAVGAMRDAVGRAVDAIGRAWDGLKRAFAAPVNWVIDNVLNKFLGWVNNIASDMNLSISLNLIPNVASGSAPSHDVRGRPMAAGTGDGPGAPRDEVFAFGPRAVRTIGPDNLASLRDAAHRGEEMEIGDGHGILGRIKDVATAALNAARERIINTVRPGFDAAMGLMDRTVGQWGVPGQLAAGTTRTLGNGILDWMSGIEQEADSRVPDLTALPGGGGPVGRWRSMWAALSGAFPGARLHSAYRPGAITATGNPSYHGMGRAIDVTPSMAIFNWIKTHYPNSREIIFSPAGGAQVRNGRNHMYTGVTRRDHWDHVHWAYDQGGMLPTGVTQVANWTGKPEAVLTDRQWRTIADLASKGPQTVDRSVHLQTVYQGAEMTPARLVHTLRKAQLLEETVDA